MITIYSIVPTDDSRSKNGLFAEVVEHRIPESNPRRGARLISRYKTGITYQGFAEAMRATGIKNGCKE